MKKEYRLELGWLLLVALGSTACEDEAAVVTAEPHPTIIEVSPEYFLSADRCVDAPGGVRTYVATLFDVTPVDGKIDRFALPSSNIPVPCTENATKTCESLPIPCSHSVAFGWVVPGHSYDAEILAFDREGLKLLAPGVPVVLDAATGEPVTPRWSTKCGATRAEAALTQQMIDCVDLPTDDSAGATAVEVGIEAAIGKVPCGQGAGEVATFLVRRNGVEVGQAACAERVHLEGLTAGEFVELEVLAFTAGSDAAILGGVCSTTAVSGLTLSANCSPFQDKGAIELDVPALLEYAGARCDANLSSFAVVLDGGAASRSFTAKTCSGRANFQSQSPGAHSLEGTLSVRGADAVTLHCTATVEPGLSATPACDPI